MSQLKSQQCLRVAGLVIDPDARRILAAGRDVPVEPKVFDLLHYLCRHPGRAIAQDELLQAVWGRSVASDTVIAQAVHKLRQVFRNHSRQPEALVTLRGVGYRLDADVEPIPEATRPQQRLRSRWPMGAAALILATGLFTWWQIWLLTESAAPRVALLALENATEEPELEWARAGIGAILREQLLRRGIDVISAREVQRLRDQSGERLDEVTAARTLAGAGHVYQPRLVSDPEGFRLELLSRTGNGRKLLAQTGSRPASLSFALGEQLARELGGARHTPAGQLADGNPFLEEAYARAYHHRQSGEFDDSRELYEYILKERSQAHWARYHLSITLRYAGDMEGARGHLQTLMEEDIDDAWLAAAIRSTLGNLEWYAGNLAEAESLYESARQRFASHDMLGGVASALGNLGMVAFTRAEFERGRELAERALAIYEQQGNRIQQARVMHNIGYSHFDQGDYNSALLWLESAHRLRRQLDLTDQAANTLSLLAEIAVATGRLQEGVRLFAEVQATFEQSDNRRGLDRTRIDLAGIAYQQGRYAEARDLGLAALAGLRTREEVASMAQAALVVSRSLRALGDWQGAVEHIKEVEQIWTRLENEPGQLVCLGERIRLALDRGQPAQARRLLDEMARRLETFEDPRFNLDHAALSVRVRLAEGVRPDPEQLEALAENLDHDNFEHIALAVELAEPTGAPTLPESILKRLHFLAEGWASQYYPAARLLYTAAETRDQCHLAARALKQLQGPDWQLDLPPSEACQPAG